MNETAISRAKANHLFWLGRYAERVYTTIALLREAWDRHLDGDPAALPDCFTRLGGRTETIEDSETRLYSYLFDPELPGSLAFSLERVFDNGIVLRDDLKSETLSYVHLCRTTLIKCAEDTSCNLTGLQPISDYILAFWGAVAERVYDADTLRLLYVGKNIEYMDLHIRFEYPFERMRIAWLTTLHLLDELDAVVDQGARGQLAVFFLSSAGKDTCPESLLVPLNRLVLV